MNPRWKETLVRNNKVRAVEKEVRRESDEKSVLNQTSYETKQTTFPPWVSVCTNKGYGVD